MPPVHGSDAAAPALASGVFDDEPGARLLLGLVALHDEAFADLHPQEADRRPEMPIAQYRDCLAHVPRWSRELVDALLVAASRRRSSVHDLAWWYEVGFARWEREMGRERPQGAAPPSLRDFAPAFFARLSALPDVQRRATFGDASAKRWACMDAFRLAADDAAHAPARAATVRPPTEDAFGPGVGRARDADADDAATHAMDDLIAPCDSISQVVSARDGAEWSRGAQGEPDDGDAA